MILRKFSARRTPQPGVVAVSLTLPRGRNGRTEPAKLSGQELVVAAALASSKTGGRPCGATRRRNFFPFQATCRRNCTHPNWTTSRPGARRDSARARMAGGHGRMGARHLAPRDNSRALARSLQEATPVAAFLQGRAQSFDRRTV